MDYGSKIESTKKEFLEKLESKEWKEFQKNDHVQIFQLKVNKNYIFFFFDFTTHYLIGQQISICLEI